ncbi:zinc finger protein 99-like [Monomorium pharaonis]|uniref:zinc finger protein 99-like n=1 Tax=Monomorium pharaonis TaxID=307658 RepID=UPI0017470440|nr:zinc finger protein 99-like [Monomorium pharaonis]
MYPCDTCDRQYRRIISLQRHKKFECGKEAQFGYYYRRGNLGPSSFAKYNCEACGKIYRSWASLRFHRHMECRKEPNFLCTFCNYRSRRKSNLRRHMQISNDISWFIQGQARVARLISVARSLMWDSGTDLKLCLLPFAGNTKEYGSMIDLSEEEALDLPAQMQEKTVMPFAELKIPKAWNYIKNPLGRFACAKCGRSYRRKDSLQRHKHWECGKEPQFKCPYCPQRCKPEDLSITGLKWAAAWQRWSVPSIMWRSGAGLGKGLGSGSSNPEGFNCPACGRVYKLKSSLRNHQKWECGKEPQFQCPHCVYKAKQKMHIARHMERMHKEKIYKQELV